MKRFREKYGGEPAKGSQTCLPLVLDQRDRDTRIDDDESCSKSLPVARCRLALLALLIFAASVSSLLAAPLSAYSLSRRYYHSTAGKSQLDDWNIRSGSTLANKSRGNEHIFIDEIDDIFPSDDEYATEIRDYIRLLHRRLEEVSTPTCEEPSTWVNKVPAPVLYIIIAVLVLFSAFFSGLTLALMGLDTSDLEIVMSGDDPALARAAERIHPLRKDGNLLLCTLLLGNVAVNTLLGILMADITSGTVGFISSTALIVIFGEIIPQASFSRYALQVGEKAVPIMKVIIIIFYILAKPLAFCLDKVLGYEIGTTYSKKELSKLLEMHVNTGQINTEEGKAMKGALQYQDMTVREVMTPIENTYMLNVENKLNFETMATIFKTGYSRIPVYEDVCTNIIGMLFVKDLIFINPVDETPG